MFNPPTTSDKQKQLTRSSGNPLGTCQAGASYDHEAAESAESLKHTDVPSEIRELQRSRQSFSALAENEDWLANNFDKIIHSQGIPSQDDDAEKPIARGTFAENEERILRCLGAAVILQWNTIPTKLQRELFDTAGSMGDVLKSAALRGQIARFLHKHKDEESVVDSVADIRPQIIHVRFVRIADILMVPRTHSF